MAREMRLHADPNLSTIQLFIAYIACSLGGTALSSFLLGQPPGWLAADAVCLCYVVSFIALRYEPFASYFMRLFDLPLVLPWLVFMQDVGWSHALTSFGIDRCLLSPSSLHAVATPHHSTPTAHFPYFHPPTHLSLFSALAVGWVSGTGGGLLRYGLCLLQREWRFRFPAEVLGDAPSVHVRLGLWCGVLYCALCNTHGWLSVTLLSRADAKLVVMAVVVSQVSGKRFVRWLAGDGSSGSQSVGKSVVHGAVGSTAGHVGHGSVQAKVSGAIKSTNGDERVEKSVERSEQSADVRDEDVDDGDGSVDEQSGVHKRA